MSDLAFPCSELDIPWLKLENQATGLDLPLLAWGSIKRGKRTNRGTWHFYVDDYRFQSVWEDPDRILATEANGVVEPNFSLFPQTPLPVALWRTYQKRWLARYWQEMGLRVWVDLNVAEEWSGMNLIGVPQGWRAFATHGYSERLEDLDREYQVAFMHSRGNPLFLVYGGGKKVSERCRERGWIHSQEHRNWVRREGLDEIRRWQREAVAVEAGKAPAEQEGAVHPEEAAEVVRLKASTS